MFDDEVLAEERKTQERIRDDLEDRIRKEAAVVAAAPAGAGKTHFVAKSVGELCREGRRVALATPTNEQAHALVERLVALNHELAVAFVHAQGRPLPPDIAALPGVTQPAAKDAHGEGLVVGTMSKLADAHGRGDLGAFDVLVIDEAYQADAGRYYSVAPLAPTHLLVGDAGQLDPFSSYEDATLWRGGAEDPLQTAVGVLLRNHPSTALHRLPITRRLDGRAVPVVASFYPGHAFRAAVLPGVRRLSLDPGGGSTVDRALDTAATDGWCHLLQPGAPVVRADPDTAELTVDLVRRLFDRHASARCEQARTPRPLAHDQVAVGVSHNDQKDLVRVRLDQAGLRDVVVDTANRLQGRTFEVLVAWHPLAGSTIVDAFHLDPGRLCVLLTRHRQACIVVGRQTDRELLEGIPPATPGYLGWNPDAVLDGWAAHEQVFEALDAHRMAA